jgi:hypothetical protein
VAGNSLAAKIATIGKCGDFLEAREEQKGRDLDQRWWGYSGPQNLHTKNLKFVGLLASRKK